MKSSSRVVDSIGGRAEGGKLSTGGRVRWVYVAG